jgi:hypothetical protein
MCSADGHQFVRKFAMFHENWCRESHTLKGVSGLFPIFTTFLTNYGKIETREVHKNIQVTNFHKCQHSERHVLLKGIKEFPISIVSIC